MKQAPEHLLNLIEPIVEGLGYECVGVEFNTHPKHGFLRVYIDNEAGVVMDDCTKVSHQLSAILDVEDPIQSNYQLEVSSPGADRLLFKIAHFKRFIGNKVQVSLFKSINGQRKITAMIQNVEGEVIFLQNDEKTFEVPFNVMSKARLIPDFN